MKRSPKNKSTGAKIPILVIKASTLNLEVQDAISSCAYRLYEQRGREHGYDVDDWLRAEGEVLTHIGT